MQRVAARRAARIASLALLLSLAATAPAAEPEAQAAGGSGWTEAVSPDGFFRVRAPIALEAFTQESPADAKPHATTVGVRGSARGAFDGVTQYIANCVAESGDRRSGDERIETTAKFWKAQADFSYRRKVTAGGMQGTEFELSNPKKTLRVRIFAPAERTCTVLVQWNQWAKPREEDIARFLDSFAAGKR